MFLKAPVAQPRSSVRIRSSNGGVSLSPISRKAQRAARNAGLVKLPGTNGTSSSPSSSAPDPKLSGPAATSYDILEAFFYGRAFAVTLSKKLGEVVVDAVAEVSKASAERPQRIQEFQEEVSRLARKDMAAAQLPERATPNTSSSSSGGASSSGISDGKPQDVAALVDDLRAEIAYTRAVLQLIKTNGKSGAPPGPPPNQTQAVQAKN